MIEIHKFYSVSEVAEHMRVTPKTVYLRVRQGTMPPLNGIGRKKGYVGEQLLDLPRNGYQSGQRI